MIIGRWLKKHRKQLTVHSLVIGIFILYCLFVAVPLFDRFESIEGEARLHKLSLPIVTNNIQGRIDKIDIYTHTIEIDGWAFIKDEGSENSDIYLVFKSDDKTYVFDTVSKVRLDVIEYFSEAGINLVNPGFNAIIPVRKIERDHYDVGIYIKKGDIEALQYTSRVVEF